MGVWEDGGVRKSFSPTPPTSHTLLESLASYFRLNNRRDRGVGAGFAEKSYSLFHLRFLCALCGYNPGLLNYSLRPRGPVRPVKSSTLASRFTD